MWNIMKRRDYQRDCLGVWNRNPLKPVWQGMGEVHKAQLWICCGLYLGSQSSSSHYLSNSLRLNDSLQCWVFHSSFCTRTSPIRLLYYSPLMFSSSLDVLESTPLWRSYCSSAWHSVIAWVPTLHFHILQYAWPSLSSIHLCLNELWQSDRLI